MAIYYIILHYIRYICVRRFVYITQTHTYRKIYKSRKLIEFRFETHIKPNYHEIIELTARLNDMPVYNCHYR